MSEAGVYLTDDRDLPEDQQRTLVIFPGGNGDWYVQVAPSHGRTTEGVRICTSGGAQWACPGLGVAIAEAYRAMRSAKNTPTGQRPPRVPSRQELEDELAAWRAQFPQLRFERGFLVDENGDLA
jgi:hypothetical protein